jgi:TetR/AcrR family transcriptional regulator, transcriptional repressor for nem operon
MGRVSNAKERLLQAAIELTWHRSYGTVGVDAICERAGVRKGSFYHFFRTKEDLLVQALETYWQSRKPTYDQLFSPSLPPLDRLRGYFAALEERQRELHRMHGQVLGCFLACLGGECSATSPLIAAKAREILTTHVRYLESALRDAQAEGQARSGNPRALAESLFAYVEGALGQARIHNDLHMIQMMSRTALSLIAPPPGNQLEAAL